MESNFSNTSENTRVTEEDFVFEPTSLDIFYNRHSLTIIFLTQGPELEADLPDRDTPHVFVDDSFTLSQSSIDSKPEIKRLNSRVREVVRDDGLKV